MLKMGGWRIDVGCCGWCDYDGDDGDGDGVRWCPWDQSRVGNARWPGCGILW